MPYTNSANMTAMLSIHLLLLVVTSSTAEPPAPTPRSVVDYCLLLPSAFGLPKTELDPSVEWKVRDAKNGFVAGNFVGAESSFEVALFSTTLGPLVAVNILSFGPGPTSQLSLLTHNERDNTWRNVTAEVLPKELHTAQLKSSIAARFSGSADSEVDWTLPTICEITGVGTCVTGPWYFSLPRVGTTIQALVWQPAKSPHREAFSLAWNRGRATFELKR